MTSDSSKQQQNRDLDDVLEEEPESKHGTEGEAANEGRRVGANSDEAGKPQAPQTGSPRGPERVAE